MGGRKNERKKGHPWGGGGIFNLLDFGIIKMSDINRGWRVWGYQWCSVLREDKSQCISW